MPIALRQSPARMAARSKSIFGVGASIALRSYADAKRLPSPERVGTAASRFPFAGAPPKPRQGARDSDQGRGAPNKRRPQRCALEPLRCLWSRPVTRTDVKRIPQIVAKRLSDAILSIRDRAPCRWQPAKPGRGNRNSRVPCPSRSVKVGPRACGRRSGRRL